MADIDFVDLDEEATEAKFSRSDYAQVLFDSIPETYPTGTNIECRYTITPSLIPGSRDWVGLYRVGWSTCREHIHYEWAPLPGHAEQGKSTEGRVIFQASTLPKDDGEFYQFCYVTSSGQVRGASTPFQFKQPVLNDFVAIEDEDHDIMVVKSRTAALEEDLVRAARENEQLMRNKECLETERDGLLSKLVEMEKKIRQIEEEKAKMELENKGMTEQLQTLKSQEEDMVLVHDGLREKIANVNQEKTEILTRLEENEKYISSLREKIKGLISDKDSLVGKNRMLEEEKQLYKSHFTTSENTLQGYMVEIDHLKKQLAVREDEISKRREEVTHLQSVVTEHKQKLDKHNEVSMTDKEIIEDLRERLQNTDDKLQASEESRSLTAGQVTALLETQEKMSADLEESKSEAHCHLLVIEKLHENQAAEEVKVKSQIDSLKQQLHEKTKEKEELSTMLAELQERMKKQDADTEREDSALCVLQMAQADLKKRFSRLKYERDSMRVELDLLMEKKAEWEKEKEDVTKQLEDMRERLQMGQEEFQAKYIECRKLQLEIKKLKRGLRSPSRQMSVSSADAATVTAAVMAAATHTQTEKSAQSHKSTETRPKTTVEQATQLMKSTTDKATEVVKQTTDKATEVVKYTTDVATEVVRSTSEKATEVLKALTDTCTTDRSTDAKQFTSEKSTAVEKSPADTTTADRSTDAKQFVREQSTHIDRPTVEAQTSTSMIQQDVADLTNSELQAQLDDLGRELEHRNAKKLRYREKYREEKEKNAFLQRYYFEELRKKDAEIQHHEKKVAILQRKLEEKEQEIHRLQGSATVDRHAMLPSPPPVPEGVDEDLPPPLEPIPCPDDMPPLEPIPLHAVADKYNADGETSMETAERLSKELDIPLPGDAPPVLAPPLTPLPAPLQPEVLPSAKLAAVKARCGASVAPPPEDEYHAPPSPAVTAEIEPSAPPCEDMTITRTVVNDHLEDFSRTIVNERCQDAEIAMHISNERCPENYDADDENFEDALSEPPKQCPICSVTFPVDTSDTVFSDHIDTHYGPNCPLCSASFEVGCSPETVQEHVNSHFAD